MFQLFYPLNLFHKLIFFFTRVYLYYDFSRDFISITDGKSEVELTQKTGSLGNWTIRSKTPNVVIRFTSDHIGKRKGFRIKVEFIKRDSCTKDGFLCANDNCLVTVSQLCDGHNDCGDNSDESTLCYGMHRMKSAVLNI